MGSCTQHRGAHSKTYGLPGGWLQACDERGATMGVLDNIQDNLRSLQRTRPSRQWNIFRSNSTSAFSSPDGYRSFGFHSGGRLCKFILSTQLDASTTCVKNRRYGSRWPDKLV